VFGESPSQTLRGATVGNRTLLVNRTVQDSLSFGV
jgi:hypothetical protein